MAPRSQLRRELTDEQRELVLGCVNWAKAFARKFSNKYPRISLDDLQSAAYEGLVDAALRYDGRVKFTHYATFYMRFRFQKIRELCHAISVPPKMWFHQNSVNAKKRAYEVVDGHWYNDQATLNQLAQEEPEESEVDTEQLQLALDQIGGKHAEVLRRCYLQKETLRQVSESWGISKQAVHQMKYLALAELRHILMNT